MCASVCVCKCVCVCVRERERERESVCLKNEPRNFEYNTQLPYRVRAQHTKIIMKEY